MRRSTTAPGGHAAGTASSAPAVVLTRADHTQATATAVRGGLRWTGASQGGRVALQVVSQIVLARLLSPADFGVAATAFTITGFAAVFADSGVQAAVIQRDRPDERFLSAAFTVGVVSSGLVALAVAAAAPLAALVVADPRVKGMIYLGAPAILLSGTCGVHRGLLERAMSFRGLAAGELLAAAAGTATAVVAATAGGGVYALGLSGLVGAALGTAACLFLCRWRPRVLPDRAAVRELSRFSNGLLGFNVVNYWARNLDNVLVARFLGVTEAGLYTRAYAFLLFPLTQVSAVLGRVMFPSLSALQSDRQEVARIYLKAVRHIAAVAWLPMVTLALVADRFVPLLLGDTWRETGTIVAVFALVGAVQVIYTTVGWLYLSQGATRLMLRWGLGNSVVYLLSFVLGVALHRAVWVAVTYALTVVLTWLPSMWSACRLVDLRLGTVLAGLRDPAACAVAAAATAAPGYLLRQVTWLSLAYQVVAATLAYGAVACGVGLVTRPQLAAVVARRRGRSQDGRDRVS